MKRPVAFYRRARNALARLLTVAVIKPAEEAVRRLKVCENCGENLYYGLPCPELRRPWMEGR